MRYDDEDELGRAANQRWATFPDPGSEEECEAFQYESRQRIREMYARVLNDPERAYRHDELQAKLEALESEWHAKDVAAGRVPESALPPLRTTDDPPTSDVEERAPRRQTRDEVWERAAADERAKIEARGPSVFERLERWSDEHDDPDPVVRGPRRPGAASRLVHSPIALAKGMAVGAVVAGVLWLLALWGLSALFDWYIWGTGLMVSVGAVCGVGLLIWFGMVLDEVRNFVRSGGPTPFRRRYW